MDCFAAALAVVVADELLSPGAWFGGLLVVVAMGTADRGVRVLRRGGPS